MYMSIAAFDFYSKAEKLQSSRPSLMACGLETVSLEIITRESAEYANNKPSMWESC